MTRPGLAFSNISGMIAALSSAARITAVAALGTARRARRRWPAALG